MITTVTLNVAVDKAYVLDDKLRTGTVSRVKTCSNTPGGKGLNVAKVIRHCKEEVLATGFVGGHNGAYVVDMLNTQQVPNRFVRTEGETRCCINILAADGSTTEFLEPGTRVEERHVKALYQLMEELAAKSQVITISGSVPEGVEIDVYRKLIGIVKKAGKKVILDTSGELLKEGIKEIPTMIKPNQDEIQALLGVPVSNREEIIRGAVKLHKMGIPYVVVSLGKDGAILVCQKGIYQGKPPRLDVVNTVGCGDAMIGAFAVGMARRASVCEMLRYAVAVSAANALTLETGDFNPTDMEQILKRVEVISL